MNSKQFNVDIITSRANSTIVKIAKLNEKKYRNDENLFICNGIKLFEEAVSFGAKIRYIIIQDDIKFDTDTIENIEKCIKDGSKLLCVSENVFEKITDEKAPQGLLCVCDVFAESLLECESTELKNEKIMMFESIRDPGNVGAILRSAAAFGIDRIIFSDDSADIYSPKVARASMGAIFKVKINRVASLKEAIVLLKRFGKNVISTTLTDNSLVLGDYTLSKNDVIIIGNEGHGLSRETIDSSDETLFIPMNKSTESLNAAIASSIIMWEMSKL